MIASGHSEASGLERFAVVFIVIGGALCGVGVFNIIIGLALIWITAIIGVIFLVIGIPLLVIGIIQYKRGRDRLKQAVRDPQQTTPTVVGYNPANYGTQGQTPAQGYVGPQGQPDIPPKPDYPAEPMAPPPSYKEIDKE